MNCTVPASDGSDTRAVSVVCPVVSGEYIAVIITRGRLSTGASGMGSAAGAICTGTWSACTSEYV